MMRVLAVDVGGTKTATTLYEGESAESLTATRRERFESAAYSGVLAIMAEFLQGERVDAAGFGVAGPVRHGHCQITNLPWSITRDQLVSVCGTEHVALLNDVQAAMMGVGAVPESGRVWLQRGDPDPHSLEALVSVGTGFGRALMVPGGHAFAAEGGYASFAPRNVIERRLLEWLAARHENVCIEHVVSGPGLFSLYNFIVESGLAAPAAQLEIECAEDPSARVGQLGVRELDHACAAAVGLFVDILGSVLGNVALEVLPRGGLYLWGGVVTKLRPAIEQGELLDAFVDKDSMGELLRTIPLALIEEPELGILGARQAALALLSTVKP
jgi:glucokinase